MKNQTLLREAVEKYKENQKVKPGEVVEEGAEEEVA